MNICFLDKTEFKYNEKDKYKSILRGAETTLINLSNELRNKGHNVIVYNNCPTENNHNNWKNINNSIDDDIIFDVAISNADANLFNYIRAKKKFVISYSLQSIEKFVRKKQLLSYFKHKPKYILIGKYHKKNRSKLISLFGASILNLGVDDIFIKTELSADIDMSQAIFTSRSDRNSDLLINIWKDKIYPNFKSGKLLITPNKNEDPNFNIVERKMKSQTNLINDLLKSKIFLVPGHKAELFCLAAEEARELCIPIITMGIGSLYERVDHGKTGFIAKNENEFANYTLQLFQNNDLWNEMRSYLIKLRGKSNWTRSTNNLLSIIS
jgi:glycosyltransferase involved in cell wall biosynthesis